MYSPMDNIDETRNWTLTELSREKAAEMTFSVVYLTVVLIVGVIGNALVLKIFYFRFHPSTHRCFILVLASYDLFACAVGTPFTIAEMFFAFTYRDVVSCKIFRFILYYTCIASSLTLVLIAFERFRKICRPLKPQMTVVGAKKALFVVVGIISTLSGSPALVFYGVSTIPSGYRNVTGSKCFISDTYKDTMWPTLFNVYLVLLALFSTACMSICYIRIARKIATVGKDNVMKRAGSNDKGEDVGKPSTSGDSLEYSDYESDTSTQINGRVSVQLYPERNLRKSMETLSISGKSGTSTSASNRDLTRVTNNKGLVSKISSSTWKGAKKIIRNMSSRSGRNTLRITKMLTVVTIAFMVSYSPHLTLMLWSMLTQNEEELPTDNVYQVIFYSFFINNLVNPFIYAAMDLKFRRALKDTIKCRPTRRDSR